MNSSILSAIFLGILLTSLGSLTILATADYISYQAQLEIVNWIGGLVVVLVVTGYCCMGIQFGFAMNGDFAPARVSPEKLSANEEVMPAFRKINDVIGSKAAFHAKRA